MTEGLDDLCKSFEMIDAGTLTPTKIRAFREVCMSGSPLAEDCDVAVGVLVLDDGDPDDNIAMATDRIVDAINARVRSRSKGPDPGKEVQRTAVSELDFGPLRQLPYTFAHQILFGEEGDVR